MRDRQALILYLAALHRASLSTGLPRAFCSIKLSLVELRNFVYDFRPVLDYFFEVKQLGFNVSSNNADITELIPKDVDTLCIDDIQLVYQPPPRPDGIVSKVFIRQERAADIRSKLTQTGRFDLVAPVNWLLARSEVNFVFQPTGKLQQRDTSVWPIANVQAWPRWLREELFGPGIDIDAAYAQFLLSRIQQVYSSSTIAALFPDLQQLVENKIEWRKKICETDLQLPWNDDTEKLIKNIIMSLSNGSSISAQILKSGARFSEAAQLIRSAVPYLTDDAIKVIGDRLNKVAKQFVLAKKQVCRSYLHLKATRTNRKLVFRTYFEWERAARYAIWEEVDRHGIMMHDGIDGLPQRYLDDLDRIVEAVGIKLTA